ncbi:unnamed protein product [Brassicogethes aeneus]|uniref:Uncharacterized protein n=1 Tax=Brassicogethes aeneus TaxID=1431903 RepID=A0A9P0BG85_BRAAE|nr:unnamed protein product [Brassicogethes aeneus]
MVFIKKPSMLEKPWVLSSNNDKNVVSIEEDVTRELTNYQLLGINFLYQNYKAKLQGAILNEEDGMNMILQVCSFLNSISKDFNGNFLILVVCPDDLIKYWRYHLSLHSKLEVIQVNSESNFEDFNGKKLALLLGFSNLNLVDNLVDNEYFSVIFDDFDLVANKRNVKKLTSSFNIGLTKRNFILNKDQKLKWTMLNWSNKGCVGKLSEFYDVDKNNLEKLRDNYRHWWFRLTWNYCESFKKYNFNELNEYNKKVKNYSLLGGNKSLESNVSPKAKKVKNSKYTPLDIEEYSKPVTEKKTKTNNEEVSPSKSCEKTLEELKKSPKKFQFIDCTNKVKYSPNKQQKQLKRPSSEEDLEKGFEKEPETEIVPLKDFFKHSYSPTKKHKTTEELPKTQVEKATCSKPEDSVSLTQKVSPIKSQSIADDDDEIERLLRETDELLGED